MRKTGTAKSALLFSGIFTAVLLITASAPGAVLTSSITTSKFSVGDQIRFSVNIITAKGTTITPPTPESDFGKITVKEWNVHKTEREKSDSCLYDYIITTYTPEPCTIPALPFILENNGTADTLRTEALPLQIVSVLPSDTVDILDLKPPFTAGKAPKWWLWLLCSLTAAGLLTFGGIWLSRRLRKVPPPPPPVPPYEEAIDALLNLALKKYLQRGLLREQVFELSEIFKRYIGRRFDCNAVEFTTEEIIAWSGAADLSKKLRAAIEWFFRTSDPVKFARFTPESAVVERFEQEIRDFLEATKPVVQEATASPSATGSETQKLTIDTAAQPPAGDTEVRS
jgi:hypothetical protein